MSQSLSNVLLHVIFSTKNRIPFIDSKVEDQLYKYLAKISKENDVNLISIGGMPDHVHILCKMPRKISISQYLEALKKSSSKWIKTIDKSLFDFSWQKGYGVFSVSFSQHQEVNKYISNQKTHHQKLSFQEEYRRFLELNKIEYNEKYIWD